MKEVGHVPLSRALNEFKVQLFILSYWIQRQGFNYNTGTEEIALTITAVIHYESNAPWIGSMNLTVHQSIHSLNFRLPIHALSFDD